MGSGSAIESTPTLEYPSADSYSLAGETYVRITKLLDQLSKPALVFWAAKEERLGVMAVLEEAGYRDPQQLLDQLAARNGKFKNGAPQYGHQRKSDTGLVDGGNAHDLVLNALCARQGWPSRWGVPEASDQARIAAAAGLRFVEATSAEPDALEETVWSSEWKVAGTCDFRGHMIHEGKRIQVILDWKTSTAIFNEYQLQLAFYRKAYIERALVGLDPGGVWGGVVRLPKDGKQAEVKLWSPAELEACEPAILGLRDVWLWKKSFEKKGNGK